MALATPVFKYFQNSVDTFRHIRIYELALGIAKRQNDLSEHKNNVMLDRDAKGNLNSTYDKK